jgi:ParB family transcriptional regulator, chromosome partitioning protein
MADGKIVLIHPDRIRPFPDQPREYFDQAALKDLARSIAAEGQKAVATITSVTGDPHHEWELIDGQRRWHACKMLNRKLRCEVDETVKTSAQRFRASFASNFAREPHNAIEIARSIGRLLEDPEIAALPSAQQQRQKIADIAGRSFTWVYQHESLLRLHPDVLAMLHPTTPEKERLPIQTAMLLTQLPRARQLETAARIKIRKPTLRGAQQIVRQAMRDAPQADFSPSMQPARIRGRFLGSVKRVTEEIEQMLDMAHHDFARMFENQPREERESAMFRLDACLEQLTTLRQSVARMVRKAA